MTSEIKRPVFMMKLFDGSYAIGRFKGDTPSDDVFDAIVEYPGRYLEHVAPAITTETVEELRKNGAPAEMIAEAEKLIGRPPGINVAVEALLAMDRPRDMTLRFQGYWRVRNDAVIALYEEFVAETERATSGLLLGSAPLPRGPMGRSAPPRALR